MAVIRFKRLKEPYGCLSNFSPHPVFLDGTTWPTVEHYFQAQKFILPAGAEHRERIRSAASPKQAKAFGLSRAHPIRPDWVAVREEVMRHALRKKFQNPELRQVLLGTENRELIENSPFDRYWGAGRDGRGRNRLGALLMELRAELREGAV